jgi:hypothetical protein
MLRRYDTIGREITVLKDITRAMPADLEAIYGVLLADCSRRTPQDQREALRVLFAWVAFSMRPVTLDEMTSLKDFLSPHDAFSIGDELQERLSR